MYDLLVKTSLHSRNLSRYSVSRLKTRMNKFYKNMVLCSELDYHCLLCKESFENKSDVEKHIRWEKHRHSIKFQNIAPKYKQFIHKIGEIYYCETCNYVVNTKGLQEHVKSNIHKESKNNPENVHIKFGLGKREESDLIRFPKLLVNRLQWHGIHNRKCLLCEDTIENVHDHISTTKHMVFVIQSPVVEMANSYFRKIEDNKFYCFGCSDIISNDLLIKHICKKEKGKKSKEDEDKKRCESPEFLKIIADIEKDEYDIDITNKTAKCKLCNASVEVALKAMSKHTLQYHEDTFQYKDPEDHGKRRSELARYGKENFIRLNKGGSKGYCSLCDIHISAHMKVAIQHVSGLKHRGHLEIKGLVARKRHSVPGYRTIPLQLFVKHIFHAEKLKSICINYSVCIDSLSFMFFKTIEHNDQLKRKCFCCDVVLDLADLNEHWETRRHSNAFASVDVLLMDDEFIRIVRSDLFHCGFCNQVFPFWESMTKHVASWAHGVAKKKAELACALAMQLYTEQETNGAVTFSDDLYLRCVKLGIL